MDLKKLFSAHTNSEPESDNIDLNVLIRVAQTGSQQPTELMNINIRLRELNERLDAIGLDHVDAKVIMKERNFLSKQRDKFIKNL